MKSPNCCNFSRSNLPRFETQAPSFVGSDLIQQMARVRSNKYHQPTPNIFDGEDFDFVQSTLNMRPINGLSLDPRSIWQKIFIDLTHVGVRIEAEDRETLSDFTEYVVTHHCNANLNMAIIKVFTATRLNAKM